MHNKKILLVSILIIAVGMVFVLKYKDTISFKPNPTKLKILTNKPDLKCSNGWREYSNDVIGIAFCYPESWGEPRLSPQEFEYLTRLEGLADTTSDEEYLNNNSMLVQFYSSDETRSILEMRFFNEDYAGEAFGSLISGEKRYVDNIENLKKASNSCAYKVQLNDRISEIWSSCTNNTKTVLTEEKDYYESTGYRYNYTMDIHSYKKISNGYYNHVLISRHSREISQTKSELKNIDAFFDYWSQYSGDRTNAIKSRQELKDVQKEYEKFLSSIKAYQLPAIAKTEFKENKKESKNVSLIREYYWNISNGNVEAAYAALADEDKSILAYDDYKKQYENIYFIEPIDIKEVSDGIFELDAKYREHNSKEEKIHVKLGVKAGKIQTILFEQYLTEVQKFENMSAYAAKRGDKNYLILNKGDREIIIDSGIADVDEHVSISDLRDYYNLKFSPTGKYLMYTTMIWEWGGGNLYDTIGEKIVSGEVVSSMENAIFHFTSDEKNLYICSSVGIASGPGGYVYSVPDFNKKYDLLQNPATENFWDVDCESSKSNASIIFKLSNKYDKEDNYSDDKISIEYFLETGLELVKNGS